MSSKARICADVFTEVENIFKVPRKDILGKSKKAGIIGARFYLYRRLRENGFTLEEIGLACNRDHGTVLSGLRKEARVRSWGLLGEEQRRISLLK